MVRLFTEDDKIDLLAKLTDVIIGNKLIDIQLDYKQELKHYPDKDLTKERVHTMKLSDVQEMNLTIRFDSKEQPFERELTMETRPVYYNYHDVVNDYFNEQVNA